MSDFILDSPIRCCLPEEEFRLAQVHETEEMHRYRGFALSFLPHFPCISRLMKAFGIDCEQRLEHLVAMAEGLGLAGKLSTPAVPHDLEAQQRRQHFFVADNDVAQLTLGQALAASYGDWQFYQLMLDSCGTPDLHVLLHDVIEQKINACRVLEEVWDTWEETLICQHFGDASACPNASCLSDRLA